MKIQISVLLLLGIVFGIQGCSDNVNDSYCNFGPMSEFSYSDSLTVVISPDSIRHLVFIEHYRSHNPTDTLPIKITTNPQLHDTIHFFIKVKATDYSSSARWEFDSYKGHDTLYVWHTLWRPYFLPQKLFLAKATPETVQCLPPLGRHTIDTLAIHCASPSTFNIQVLGIN